MGIEHKIVDKSGAWFSYGDLRIGQGRENSKQFLRDNLDVAAEIEIKIREKLGLPTDTVVVPPKPAAPAASTASAASAADPARKK